MKDIFGKDIKIGDYILYILSSHHRHFEKAIIVESEKEFVKIEYLGISSTDSWRKKEKGKKSRLTATRKKVVIINSESSDEDEKNVYKDEKKRFDEIVKKITKKLKNSSEREKELLEQNNQLQKEVDKIHHRFDILDL